mgnify:CR=1 FL=1
MKPEPEGPHNFIGGKWRRAGKGGGRFDNLNPATGEFLGAYPDSTRQDLDEAVLSAKKAFESWRKVPAAKRGEVLLFSDPVDELWLDHDLVSNDTAKAFAFMRWPNCIPAPAAINPKAKEAAPMRCKVGSVQLGICKPKMLAIKPEAVAKMSGLRISSRPKLRWA